MHDLKRQAADSGLHSRMMGHLTITAIASARSAAGDAGSHAAI